MISLASRIARRVPLDLGITASPFDEYGKKKHDCFILQLNSSEDNPKTHHSQGTWDEFVRSQALWGSLRIWWDSLGRQQNSTYIPFRRAVIVAGNVIPVGKETDRHWEQGGDPSMLDPKIQIYGRTGKLVAADEDKRREWAKIGVRKLMRATKLTQKAIYAILSGQAVRKDTMHVFRTGLISIAKT